MGLGAFHYYLASKIARRIRNPSLSKSSRSQSTRIILLKRGHIRTQTSPKCFFLFFSVFALFLSDASRFGRSRASRNKRGTRKRPLREAQCSKCLRAATRLGRKRRTRTFCRLSDQILSQPKTCRQMIRFLPLQSIKIALKLSKAQRRQPQSRLIKLSNVVLNLV